jgi:hypothetical protein
MNGTTIFFWGTLVFIFLKTLFDYKSYQLSAQYSHIILFIFSMLFFIFLFINNVKFTEDEMVCGKKDIKIALINTFIPYVFIYGLGIALLTIFPGWVRSFANTFGLSMVKMRGLGDTIEKWLGEKNTNSENKDFNIMIERIYSDPDVLINELYVDDAVFDASNNISWSIFDMINKNIKNSSGSNVPLTPEELTKQNEIKRELIGFINIKNTIGQYIWVLLLSIITILTSRNALLNESCYNGNSTNFDTKYQDYIKSKLK